VDRGHAGNAVCIVGFRNVSKELLANGLAFAASYDSTTDPDGTVLSEVLTELIPSCSKVNLDYFFARIDNENYGVGRGPGVTEASLTWKMIGQDGDLRAGLPWELVKAHEPVRLLVIVEAPPDLVKRAITTIPSPTLALFKGRWVRLISVDSKNRVAYRLGNNGFQTFEFKTSC
jgi:uncharacterized protein